VKSLEQRPHAVAAPVRVLLIEDDPRDALLIQEYLKQPGETFEVIHVTRIEEATRWLVDPSIDAILVDLNLPDAFGIQAVVHVHASCVGQPILAITGLASLDTGLEAVRLGAQDFLVKDGLSAEKLTRSIRYSIERQRLLGCIRDSARASLMDGENFRRLLLGGTEALVVVDTTDHIRFANQAAEALFGWTGRDHLGRPLGLTAVPGIEMEHEILRDDGTVAIAELRCVDVLWQEEPARLLSLRDVSEQRRASERQMRLDMLTAFLGNVSHELRTPLAAIYQFVSNVGDGIHGPVNHDQRKNLNSALRNVDEVLAMIANLLEVARAQAGKLRIEPRIMQLDSETSSLSDVLQASARERQLGFGWHVSGELPPLAADPARVRQIITNLVENAIKFTTSPGSVRVVAEYEAAAGRVIIRVSDTGCGVPPEHLEHIFDQLHQVPESLYRTRRGLGLGLFITRELVRGLRGDIRVQSKPGEGATFEVSLPVMSWREIVESIRRRELHSREAVAVRIRLEWAEGDSDEPIPETVVWAMHDLLREQFEPSLIRLLPAAQAGRELHLGAILEIEPNTQTSLLEELNDRIGAEPSVREMHLLASVECMALDEAAGGLGIEASASRLERFYLHLSQGDVPCLSSRLSADRPA
jgi:signal transduction histidine kinase